MFKPEPGRRYDMPVVFGPSDIGAQATYGETRMIAHAFLTDPAALEPLVPYHFTLAEPAKVTVIGRTHTDVDWLAGRGYRSVRISIDVLGRDGEQVIKAPYGLVVWESDPHPVISGREYLGISKMVGEMPDHEYVPGGAAFECYEYGTRLLRVTASGLQPVLQREPSSGSDSITFGWKFIPGPRGVVDVDYPVKQVSRSRVTSMSTGTGSVVWDAPTWDQCPFSARIIGTLAALPVLEVLPATVTVSAASQLDRAASSRLD
ncbi:acetoacetate decarboxylase family protein [Jatrophihabitans cynanchi]|uniref:Acetoacetate decarboxylase family protein n=1 Tax=Jatrophihabitans cynanchi TaxID=2944128 RepID=A0ABY7K0S2_9ACTN|nr:acetoacetate decarboxylase family protein [Jatrophihabitans sp. SB3-54]WAX58449.1 acetoacetate decarboxylase family protein [Jatrophihabitans sp. SB3-54]